MLSLLLCCMICVVGIVGAQARPPSESNCQHVNPLIGTASYYPSTAKASYGGLIPSTMVPFAMTRWSAVTRKNYVSAAPYEYKDKQIHGFIGTHQPAIWMGENGQVSLQAGIGKTVLTSFDERGIPYSHDDEEAHPHYYKVKMQYNQETDSSSIVAEMTSKSHASHLAFTFDSPTSQPSFVVVQATTQNITGSVSIDADRREISGINPERQDSVSCSVL